jgi:hypothetical protein
MERHIISSSYKGMESDLFHVCSQCYLSAAVLILPMRLSMFGLACTEALMSLHLSTCSLQPSTNGCRREGSRVVASARTVSTSASGPDNTAEHRQCQYWWIRHAHRHLIG